jgi:8-oxo-dGTP pyrophosphatase MutT (NUDIX family)
MKYFEKILRELFTKPDKIEKTRMVGCGIIGRVVENNDVEILIIQRSSSDHYPNAWELPRGGCNKSDINVKNCTIREIKEETGLDVTTVAHMGKYSYFRNENEESICKIYLCKMNDINQEVKLSHEHKDYKWINSYSIAQLMINPDQLKFIHRVLHDNDEIISNPKFELSDTKNTWE